MALLNDDSWGTTPKKKTPPLTQPLTPKQVIDDGSVAGATYKSGAYSTYADQQDKATNGAYSGGTYTPGKYGSTGSTGNTQATPTFNPFDYYSAPVENYVNPNKAAIDKLVEDLLGTKPFDYASYDPEKDAAFQEFKSKNIKLGNDSYNSNVAGMSIPGMNDSSIGRQVAETGRRGFMDRIQDALPIYQDKARDDYNNGVQANYALLNMLDNQSGIDYNVWLNNQTAKNASRQGYIDNTGYIPMNKIDANDPLRAFSDNYQAQINKLKAINPKDPSIAILEQLRQEKINSDPALQKLYGGSKLASTTPMGMATQQLNQQNFNNKISTANLTGMLDGKQTIQGQQAEFNEQEFQIGLQAAKDDLSRNQFITNYLKTHGVYPGTASTSSSKTGTGYKLPQSQDFYTLVEEARNSPNPEQFVLDNYQFLDTKTYNDVLKRVKDMPMDTSKLFESATSDEKYYYTGLKERYINGMSDGRQNDYFGNPAKALQQLVSEPMNKQLLGKGLFDLLKSEIESATKTSGTSTSTAALDAKAKAMFSATDPLAWIKQSLANQTITTADAKELASLLASLKGPSGGVDEKISTEYGFKR